MNYHAIQPYQGEQLVLFREEDQAPKGYDLPPFVQLSLEGSYPLEKVAEVEESEPEIKEQTNKRIAHGWLFWRERVKVSRSENGQSKTYYWRELWFGWEPKNHHERSVYVPVKRQQQVSESVAAGRSVEDTLAAMGKSHLLHKRSSKSAKK
jgi:hypothetical protein